MKIAAFFGSLAFGKNWRDTRLNTLVTLFVATDGCPSGQQLGIAADGSVDASNDHTCYPSPDAAYVVHCNHPDTGAAEMKVAIDKDFIADRPCMAPGRD